MPQLDTATCFITMLSMTITMSVLLKLKISSFLYQIY